MKGNTVTVGTYLKEKREQKGISLEELSSKTRISLLILDALEHDRTEDLPEMVFVKGFIKSYTKVLKIDHLKPLAMYAKTCSPKEDKNILIKKEIDIKYTRFIPIFIIILTLSITWFFYKNNNNENLKTKANVPTIANKIKQLKVSNAKSTSLNKTDKKIEQTKTKDTLVDKEKYVKNSGLSENAQNGLNKNENKITNKNIQKHNIKVFAKRVVWVKVQIDNQLPFDFMMQATSKKIFLYKENIKFLFGDAGAIDITYEGKPFNFDDSVGAVRSISFPSLSKWKDAMEI